MDIRISVFPTSNHNRLIAYTTNYKIRKSLANQIHILVNEYYRISGPNYPYQIIIDNHVRFLPYDKGRAIEKLLDYISHREEIERYE